MRVTDAGNVISPVVETTEMGDEHARYLARSSISATGCRALVAEAAGAGRAAARARRRPLRRARLARRDGEGARRGRRRLGRRARRPQHAGDLAERQRPRDGARRRARARAATRSRVTAGRCPAVDPGKLALVGVRSLDDGERELLRRLDAKVFTMSDVDRMGVEPCMREALAHAAGGAFLHLSLDLDVVDPEYAPGVGTPVRGGLSYREAHLAMETVAESGLHRLDGRRRGQPDPRPRERDGPARRRARRLGARRPHPLVLRLEVRDGDIAAVEADAIANAANDRSGWAPASREPSSAPAARRSSGRRWRSARSSSAPPSRRRPGGFGALGDPRRRDGTGPADDADLVGRTTRSCLEVADELGCRSLALPAFGTGVGGFPLGDVRPDHGRGGAELRAAVARARDLRRLRQRGLRGVLVRALLAVPRRLVVRRPSSSSGR